MLGKKDRDGRQQAAEELVRRAKAAHHHAAHVGGHRKGGPGHGPHDARAGKQLFRRHVHGLGALHILFQHHGDKDVAPAEHKAAETVKVLKKVERPPGDPVIGTRQLGEEARQHEDQREQPEVAPLYFLFRLVDIRNAFVAEVGDNAAEHDQRGEQPG